MNKAYSVYERSRDEWRGRFDWVTLYVDPSDMHLFKPGAMAVSYVRGVKWQGEPGYVGTTNVRLDKGTKEKFIKYVSNPQFAYALD